MKLFNTMTGKKEEFVPISEGKVKMYACGPTVYNYIHIGNARPLIVFDALRRYMEYRGMQVTFVQNFTDVDDKMINRANEEGITVKELGERFIGEYFKDAQALGVEAATIHPKATENIDAIIELVKTLEEKGYAYNVDGDVYFSAKKFSEYGKLSKQPLDDLMAGAGEREGRTLDHEDKHDPVDFALWKKQKPGEPAWESPWGMGRPGWHIECSAMANRFLDETIDIHAGGKDLIFPHHENEIAQSECANRVPFANYWIHNGYINVDNQKMSKSLGNFFTVRDVLEKYDGETVRFFMLSVHYRNPVNFADSLMEQSKSALERVYTCIDNLEFLQKNSEERELNNKEQEISQKLKAFKEKFIVEMDDDFNTAAAISVIFDIVYTANTELSSEEKNSKQIVSEILELIRELGGVLGLFTKTTENSVDKEIEALIEQRNKARAEKNWAEADAIRDKLKAMNIELKDTPMGVKWSYIE